MKKIMFFGLIIGLALTANPILAGHTEATLWQIGKPDGDVNPFQGAAEYPANHEYYDSFDYDVDDDPDPINSPSLPGYLGFANVCDVLPGVVPCTDTAAEIHIHFSLDSDYDPSELTLIYDRYGSEADFLYLDGEVFAAIRSTEDEFRHLAVSLGPISAGAHTITIGYSGGWLDNGHYIDCLRLISTFDGVPANMNTP